MIVTNALDVGLSGGARRTGARGLMISRGAQSCFGATVRVTGGSAHPIQSVAELVIGAVLVVLANRRNTGGTRVSLSARWTVANGPVIDHRAFGAVTARNLAAQTR